MNPNRQRRLRLIAKIAPAIFMLLVCLAAIEIFARVIYDKPTMHYGIEMWKYAKFLKMAAPDPEMSHQHRPNTHAFLLGVDCKINSLGLRDYEITTNKPPGTYRIVVLGDSFTFGWGVHFDETFPKLLEKSFNANPPSPNWKKYQVINTGIGNYNTAQELASLKDKWLALDPDMIIDCWCVNDAEPTPHPSRNWLAYHSYGYTWIAAQLGGVLRNVGANKNYKEYYNSLCTPNKPGWLKEQAAFAELAQICRDRKMPLKVCLLPELHTLSGNYEFEPLCNLIRGVGATNHFEVVDVMEGFPADGDPKRFWTTPEDAHPNDAANELMAAKIDSTLRAENWIK